MALRLRRYILYAGLLITALGALLSLTTRRTDIPALIEGDTGGDIGLLKLATDMPGEYMTFGDSGDFKLKSVRAEVQVEGKPYAIRMFPPKRTKRGWARIEDIGFSLRLKLNGSAETLALKVLPPGREDKFISGGKEFSVSLEPEKEIPKGSIKGKVYNLRLPLFKVKADGKEAVLKKGEPVSLGKDKLLYEGSPLWVRVAFVKDPGLLLVYLGIGLLALSPVAFLRFK